MNDLREQIESAIRDAYTLNPDGIGVMADAVMAVLQEQDEVNRPAGAEDGAIYQAIADNYTAPTQPSVPEGWQLVPVDLDPYDDMTSAACDAGDLYRVDFARAWRAALAAAPKPEE